MFDYDFFDDPVYHITKDSAEFKNLCKKYDRMTTGIIGYRTKAEIFIKDELDYIVADMIEHACKLTYETCKKERTDS